MTKADLALSAVLAAAIAGLLAAFFTQPAFFDWAFARHSNVASWVVRPLLVLPLVWAAWRRTLAGILASVLAMLTSMFWFPAPVHPRADVLDFLAMERALLSAGWTPANIVGLLSVVGWVALLSAAFWKRSWKLGLATALAGAALKALWSVIFSPEAGAAVIPFAVGGAAVLAVTVWVWRRRIAA